ncbi:8172_t:CDS:2, partial [Rhizophagus irregularis]
PGKLKSQTKQPNISPLPTTINGTDDNDKFNNKVGSIQQPSSSQFDLDNMKDDKNDELQQLKIQRDQSQRASHLIGQNLLQGWALIDQICPNETCYGVPLIRSRDKRKYCVICQNYYLNESEFDSSRHSLTTLQSSAKNDTINEKKHQIDVKEIESTIQQLGKKVQLSYNNTNNITLEQNDTDNNKHQHDVVRKCVSTLSTKLEELSILLKNTSDVSEIKNICNTIESCAQALGAIKSLEHS